MSGPVTFNYASFVAAYPEFAALAPAQAQNYFDLSDQYFKNDATNPYALDVDRMTRYAYLITAHIAWIFAPRDASGNPAASGSPASGGLVGQITSASEGSVSVSTNAVGDAIPAFYSQSRYGVMFWQATAAARTMHYAVNPRRMLPIGYGPYRMPNWPIF